MAEKPIEHLEELNLKYQGGRRAKYVYRAREFGQVLAEAAQAQAANK